MNSGFLYALGAYALWGLVPLYFHFLAPIKALEVLAVRVLCSVLFLSLVPRLRRRRQWMGAALRDARTLRLSCASALAITVNWYLFIWAASNNRVLESALGYFIGPLVNVLIGYFALKEPLTRLQGFAVLLAAAGVVWMSWHHGALPWVALSLAVTFSTYGLLRRTAPLGAFEGLMLEMLLVAPLAAAGLIAGAWLGRLDAPGATTGLQMLLLLSGPITAIPLLMFAAGARRIPFIALGMLQYVSPSLQALVAVWLLHEPYSGARAQAFPLIWISCVIFSADAFRRSRTSAARA